MEKCNNRIKVLWEKTPGSLEALDMRELDGMKSNRQLDREGALDMAIARIMNTDGLFCTEKNGTAGRIYLVFTATGRLVGEVSII